MRHASETWPFAHDVVRTLADVGEGDGSAIEASGDVGGESVCADSLIAALREGPGTGSADVVGRREVGVLREEVRKEGGRVVVKRTVARMSKGL